MRINLYDENLKRTAIIGGQFLSVFWSEGYNTVEPFSLEIRETEDLKKKIRPECYIGRDDRKTLMVIKTVKVEHGIITATGKQAVRCLDDVPFVGTIDKDLPVERSIREAFSSGGGYAGFEFDGNDPGITYGHQISNKSVLKLMLTMCQETDLGFRAIRQNGRILVGFYRPEEKPNLRFSEAYGNMALDRLLLSTENLKNHAIVLGAGEGEQRTRFKMTMCYLHITTSMMGMMTTTTSTTMMTPRG